MSRTCCTGTAIATWIEGRKFEAKGGTAVTVPGLVGAKATSVAFAGLGDGGSADVLAAGGKIGMVCHTEKATRVAVDAGGLSPARRSCARSVRRLNPLVRTVASS